jgi:hypothetical protein
MGEHSRQEMARRAGVDPEYLDRLVKMGILSPGTRLESVSGWSRRPMSAEGGNC